MYILSKFLVFIVHGYTIPDTDAAVFIGELIENTIASQNNKVMIFCNFECFNIWFAHDYIRIATAKFKFRFWITESP